ncbi:glutamate synthase subunit beta [Sphingomonas sp.]|uniref:glutamate synthase subunit beta n=1 Tax=Sphingomonas sp. TaxID=28214 RepID=UPI00286CB8D3|nr:glutamate synthase subunit beta [Sphingomonas sp.]
MTDPTGFLTIPRHDRSARPVAERVADWDEYIQPMPAPDVAQQATRCMDCGVPFCHSACPVGNLIPDWNALVSDAQWQAACERLHRTNNFPEFTGRVCPAPCEEACTLALTDEPVTIKTIECAIVDRGWDEGWIVPKVARRGTGRRIAVVGSGPAGLACAQQLARMGHAPTVFEKADRIGGLLRYGIPDFKMDRALVDRRVVQMEAEGVIFRTGMEIGVNVTVDRILDDYDVMVLAGGAEWPRDLDVPGREAGNIYFAMDYLTQQNRRIAGLAVDVEPIDAMGKHVVVIGGGDTGSDCIGTAHRQGAASVTQLEIMPEPPLAENKSLTWPHWPLRLRTSTSQEEGVERLFSAKTLCAEGELGRVTSLTCEQDGKMRSIPADLVLLAMGFVGVPADGILAQANVSIDMRSYATSRPEIYACGDMRRGQSLVVWAIREGRDCAAAVHQHLMAIA